MILMVWKFYHVIHFDSSFPVLNVNSKDKSTKTATCLRNVYFDKDGMT